MVLRRANVAQRMAWRESPPFALAMLYLICITVGGFLLWLPIAHREGVTLGDAIFTSASAVTVTGLAVVDPGTAFTGFGQVVILLLIQLGGLGLMTFAMFLIYSLGIPISMPQRVILREELNHSSLHELTEIVETVLIVTVICELVGALLLATVFVPDLGWAKGLWFALFHSVSAFNNAGFALFPDGLMRYADDPVINLVIPALIIVGGIGFIVLGELEEKRRWRSLSLHSKLTLAGTGALILISWFLIAVLEWTNPATLGALDGTGARLWTSWFQAVTTRTAGFNTIDIAGLHDSTMVVFMWLMAIGGGSASTAGGMKVTTVIVLLIATVAFFRRQTAMPVFGRSLGTDEVMKVMALTTVSFLVIMVAILAVSISHDGEFSSLVFEVVSAFGTVGLSRGATAELDGVGRTVIIVVMFLGRIGPLTLGFFLSSRSRPRVGYPKGRIILG